MGLWTHAASESCGYNERVTRKERENHLEQPSLYQDSDDWVAFTQISFAISMIAMVVGVY